VVTLLGLLPALMVWSGRYVKKLAPDSAFRAPGGRLALLAAMAISILVIVHEMVT
jgi:heme/copper-type cytochrome/quinol oxidase subunit 1